jgi:hypothetical protein
MPLALTRYLNQAIFVSIPVLFEDGIALPYTLLGVEPNGLWLQSEQLTGRLLGDESHALAQLSPAVFVPFAQIAGVLVATSMPEPPANEPEPGSPRKPRKRAAPVDRRR